MAARYPFHTPHTGFVQVQPIMHQGLHREPHAYWAPPPPVLRAPPAAVNNEVFVGNLSFFCKEADLFALCSEYADVHSVEIARSEDGSRSRTFGFVMVYTPQQAQALMGLLHNHLFMGRRLRVEIADKRRERVSQYERMGFDLHVTFSAPTHGRVVKEPLLRKIFMHHGHVVDVAVRDYVVDQVS